MITRVPAKGHGQASTSQGEPNASKEESSFKLFSDSDIMIATNNLSKESVIGRGGFGNVHKGTIVNTEVAIKILDTKGKGTQGANEFIQEMAVLKNLKHENLVKLMGACLELRALVYEFLPRGSLEDCLNDSPQLLTWQIRTRIVYEICSILMFLHSKKPKPLVHGDLKPQNILLDADLHCRLSDFGLCRILSEFSETTGAYLHTKSINGTECYMDPDYVEHGKLTPGCDVFSFGVTILRILTGQRPLNIRRKIRKASRSNSLMTIVDSTAGDWPVEVAEYLAKSGLDCCKENRNNLKLMTELSTFIENLAEKGLMRCGKSCRLRWLNYLRPNINHGEFSDEEDNVICSLYATIGSRWSIIAAQLPGRTDNDIKNYWNTKFKKKLLGSAPFQKKPSQHQHRQRQQLFFPSTSPPLPSFPLDHFSRLRIQSPPPVNQQYQISFSGGNEKSRSSSEFALFKYSLEEVKGVKEIVEEVVKQLITGNITTTTYCRG